MYPDFDCALFKYYETRASPDGSDELAECASLSWLYRYMMTESQAVLFSFVFYQYISPDRNRFNDTVPLREGWNQGVGILNWTRSPWTEQYCIVFEREEKKAAFAEAINPGGQKRYSDSLYSTVQHSEKFREEEKSRKREAKWIVLCAFTGNDEKTMISCVFQSGTHWQWAPGGVLLPSDFWGFGSPIVYVIEYDLREGSPSLCSLSIGYRF